MRSFVDRPNSSKDQLSERMITLLRNQRSLLVRHNVDTRLNHQISDTLADLNLRHYDAPKTVSENLQMNGAFVQTLGKKIKQMIKQAGF